MKNMFKEGEEVVCVSENFPRIEAYGGTKKDAIAKPKKGEVLVIDEILGDYLRFDKYDTPESYNWWICKNFSYPENVYNYIEKYSQNTAQAEEK